VCDNDCDMIRERYAKRKTIKLIDSVLVRVRYWSSDCCWRNMYELLILGRKDDPCKLSAHLQSSRSCLFVFISARFRMFSCTTPTAVTR